jgi:hypothetical protein
MNNNKNISAVNFYSPKVLQDTKILIVAIVLKTNAKQKDSSSVLMFRVL